MLGRVFLISRFALRAENQQHRDKHNRHDHEDYECDEKFHHSGCHAGATARVVTDDKFTNGGHLDNERVTERSRWRSTSFDLSVYREVREACRCLICVWPQLELACVQIFRRQLK